MDSIARFNHKCEKMWAMDTIIRCGFNGAVFSYPSALPNIAIYYGEVGTRIEKNCFCLCGKMWDFQKITLKVKYSKYLNFYEWFLWKK